ncbi:hypothetical protein [Methylocella sp.]|uniref:hypothetical protein n=1 Tax=Methylocella sp. TaxID=1978226 RepID=UPI003782D699
MRRRALLAGGLLAVSCGLLAVSVARAEIHDYQILRLLSYRTDCQPLRVEARPAAGGTRRFFVACDNEVSYPDGAEVVCDDRDDENACRVVTAPARFDALRLMR